MRTACTTYGTRIALVVKLYTAPAASVLETSRPYRQVYQITTRTSETGWVFPARPRRFSKKRRYPHPLNRRLKLQYSCISRNIGSSSGFSTSFHSPTPDSSGVSELVVRNMLCPFHVFFISGHITWPYLHLSFIRDMKLFVWNCRNWCYKCVWLIYKCITVLSHVVLCDT
jgi:hypothetical protein